MAPSPRASGFRVVGYLPEYRLDTIDPAISRWATDLIFFGVEPTAAGQVDAARLTPAVRARLGRLRTGQVERVLACLGGHECCQGFAEAAPNPTVRRQLAAALVTLCRQHGFDGVDLYWDAPADEGQRAAYAALIEEVHRAFAAQGLLVTLALRPWQELQADVLGQVDRIHLMAYDLGTGHSTFELAVAGVEECLARGVPACKVCLGVPFYGRSVEDAETTMTYADIVRLHQPASSVDEIGGMLLNGPDTLRRKVHYARQQGLAGVMAWELGQDVHGPGSLLETLFTAATE
ncbi:MAG: glycoside hydrolase family 18 protein [Candidatus Latescibacterota bacterium]